MQLSITVSYESQSASFGFLPLVRDWVFENVHLQNFAQPEVHNQTF